MQTADPTVPAPDAGLIEEFERTLRAMLKKRVPPLCDDELSVSRHDAHAKSLNDALGRISDGTFGRCQWCGGPIAFERLEVVPTALGCQACASRQG